MRGASSAAVCRVAIADWCHAIRHQAICKCVVHAYGDVAFRELPAWSCCGRVREG